MFSFHAGTAMFMLLILGTEALVAAGAESPAPPRLEVGTYCTNHPYGITMLLDRGVAFVVNPESDIPNSRFLPKDEALVAYPTCAADGTYVHATLARGGAKISWTFGKISETVVGARLETDRPVNLPLHFLQPFSGCRTLFWREGDVLVGNGFAANTGATVPIHVTLDPKPTIIDANRSTEAEIICSLDPAHPTMLVLSISEVPVPAFDDIAKTLKSAGDAYSNRHIRAEGDWGDFLGPIAEVMNSSRYFSSLDRMLSHSVGRGWWIAGNGPIGRNADYTPYFGWDSNFNGVLGSLEDPSGSRETIRAVFSLQDPEGMISNYSHWPTNNEYVASERSDPPVAGLCVWKMYQRWPDKNWLNAIYPRLVKWHDWWHVRRCRKGQFLLSWGSGKNSISDARLETGWDDTQAFGDGRMVDGLLNEYNVDLNALWAMDAENLAYLADALGKPDDAARFRAEHTRIADEMNQKLWNEKIGLYCNRSWDDNPDGSPRFITRITPMNLYPLISGIPDPARAKRTLDYMHDPKKFWGDYPIPTLPYDDPDYHQQEYWHGHVWAPVNYLLWQGISRYDDSEHQAQFARRSVALFMKSWNTDNRICSENYRSDNGAPDDHPHYTWGALLPLIGVEALVDVGPDLVPKPRQAVFKENLTLHHIPVGGKLFRIDSKGGKTSISPE